MVLCLFGSYIKCKIIVFFKFRLRIYIRFKDIYFYILDVFKLGRYGSLIERLNSLIEFDWEIKKRKVGLLYRELWYLGLGWNYKFVLEFIM